MLKQARKRRKSRISAAIILLIAVFFLIINVVPPRKVVDDNPFIKDKILLAAHRGGKTQNPENTLKAFKAAVDEFKADILELDLCATKDDELVVIHNLFLDKTSDIEELTDTVGDSAKHYVIDYSLDELRRLNFGYKFVDEDGNRPYRRIVSKEQEDRAEVIRENDIGIVTIEDLFANFYSSHPELLYIVEIKDEGDVGKKAADKLHALLTETYPNYVDNVVIGTFHPEIEDYLATEYPDLIRGASTKGAAGFIITQIFGVNIFNKSEFYCLQLPIEYDIKGLKLNLLKKNYINRAHKRNIAVQYWTINDRETMEKIIDYGADAIMTDNPKLLDEVLRERGLR